MVGLNVVVVGGVGAVGEENSLLPGGGTLLCKLSDKGCLKKLFSGQFSSATFLVSGFVKGT